MPYPSASRHRSWRNGLAVVAFALAGPALCAQIVVGQTAGYTGTVAASVRETAEGAKLYLDAVNARGGVNGQTISLISLDDKFDPKLAAENARKLIVDRKVTALFLTRGTPHNEAIAPLLAEYKVPLVAPSTGAMIMHRPVNPYIFNVRASYQREAERAVRHLATIGITRIAIVRVDDSFGADATAGAAKGLEAAHLTPVLQAKFDRSKPDFSAIAPKVAQSQAQAVLFLASGQAVADGVKAIRQAGSKAQVVTLSNNAASGFVKQMGDYAYGTIVSQVFPSERSAATPLVAEAAALLKAKGAGELSPAMMEGYAAAKVLVEGLKRAGPAPTREKLIAALNGMSRYDLGGMELNYSPTNHSGLDFSDLSIIDREGHFRR
ncbi:MAG: ABC transporter substrate-binding protein [Proteobacteria bacterium]|nr:ABC transporter substrate-binding protein [Pseudomonadota bacterium]